MSRLAHWGGWLIAVMLGAGLAACDGGEEAASDDYCPTPTLTTDFQVVLDELHLADSGEGIDLDGDAAIDNALEPALEAIHGSVYGAVHTVLDAAAIPVSCTGQEEVCQDMVLAEVDVLLTAVFSRNGFNSALNNNLADYWSIEFFRFGEPADGIVDLTWLVGTQGDWDLQWYYTELGRQPGSLDETLSGRFGPGSVKLGAEFTSDDMEVSALVTLLSGCTVVPCLDPDYLKFVTGGTIPSSDIVAIADEVLGYVEEVLEPADVILDRDAVLSEIDALLKTYEDIDVDGDGVADGVSASMLGVAAQYPD